MSGFYFANTISPMTDHLIQKVVAHSKVTPQDDSKHMKLQEKMENPAKAKHSGEYHISASANPSDFGLGEDPSSD